MNLKRTSVSVSRINNAAIILCNAKKKKKKKKENISEIRISFSEPVSIFPSLVKTKVKLKTLNK
jgi:hypothetical protein